MNLKKLALKNFRCYDDIEIEFEDKLTVIVGENGKGKSAIFDGIAISLAPYMEAFNYAGRKVNKADIRRVPIYDETNKENLISLIDKTLSDEKKYSTIKENLFAINFQVVGVIVAKK